MIVFSPLATNGFFKVTDSFVPVFSTAPAIVSFSRNCLSSVAPLCDGEWIPSGMADAHEFFHGSREKFLISLNTVRNLCGTSLKKIQNMTLQRK